MASFTVSMLSVLMTIIVEASQSSASPVTYRVTFSSRMRPGMMLPVSVHLLRDGDSAEVFATLRNNESQAVIASASSQRVYGGGRPQVINLMIPRNLNTVRGERPSGYEVRVKAIGNINFDQTAPVTLEDKSFSIFIQTDKAIYKPGQTVMMRILAMNPDLSILKAPMDVYIKDPEDNIVRQWEHVEADDTSVLQLSMVTSTSPRLGKWTVIVKMLGLKETQSFLIDKYVLPKFEASLRVPKNVLTTDGISGTASAKYTFGKPLTEARVSVAVRLQATADSPNITSTGKLDAAGEFTFSFTNAQLLALSSQTFFARSLENKQAEVVAKVTDDSTEHYVTTIATVPFEKSEAKVEFLPITTNSFKPGLPCTVYLSVTKYDGTFFSTTESAKITFEVTTTRGKDITIRAQNLQANGLLRVDQTFPKDADRIFIQVQMKHSIASKSLDKAYSPSNNFLKVVMNTARPKVGEVVNFTAFMTENITQIYYQIPRNLNTVRGERPSGYEVRVKAIGNINFDQTAPVTLEDKSFSIFIQTDKAIYKPGQTVMMRILAMNPDLSILKAPMDVYIKDPEDNIVRQWEHVEADDTSVLQLSMVTSTSPRLGKWTVIVKMLGLKETQSFLIDKYVLPKFEASLRVPKNVLTTDGISGTASAKYTFGKPLTEARVSVAVRLQATADSPNITSTGKLDAAGEFTFSFTNAQLLALSSQTFFARSLENKQAEVVAKVTDDSTEHYVTTIATVPFEKSEAKVEFLPITTNSFKPGLPCTVYLSVTKYDGTFFSTTESAKITFEVTTTRGKDITIRAQNLQANGLLRVDQTFPKDADRIFIQVQMKHSIASKSLDKAYSPSNNFLKVVMNTARPKVGEVVNFTAFMTENITQIYYQVYTKGIMVSEFTADSRHDEGEETFPISFLVEDVMAPNARLLVFYFRPDKEVVVDSISFKVEGFSDNPINVSYSDEKVKSGKRVSLKVSAKPDSSVFLLAVDKSLQLLKTGNDITQDKITEQLVAYDYGNDYREFWHYISTNGWPYSVKGTDAKSVFKDTDVRMLTDGTISDKLAIRAPATHPPAIPAFTSQEQFRTFSFGRRSFSPVLDDELLARSNEKTNDITPTEFITIPNTEETNKKAELKVPTIRTYFPERWLWDMVTIGSSGTFEKYVVVPDTITTWLTTAFAVHPLYGLSVTPQASQLTTFQDMFVRLDLPYSVIRGEDICLKTFAFNYYDISLQMRMTLGQADGLENVVLEPAAGDPSKRVETRRSISVTQDLGLVRPNTTQEADFCFTPTKLGNLPIRVNLTSSVPGDGVEHILKVEPEGSPQVRTVSVLLDAKPNVVFSKSVPLNFPSTTVRGSQVITVSISGNLLVPVISNLEKLLRLPNGCGEQNMILFAPNVFLINYLQRTNTYTPALGAQAQNFMLTGYQKELTYQRHDGSFSTWGKNDPSGSMWLTAFVTKCFVQAMALKNNVITIDSKTVRSSIQWITTRQRNDGSFPEPGNVAHKEMQSGSAQGEAMTAFVLISLAETSVKFQGLSPGEQQSLQNSISRARDCLEARLSALTDPYDLAIVTYALHLVRSGSKDIAFELLQQKIITNVYTKHWERNQQSAALNIEMTSYGLLTYILRNDVAGAMPILRWLMELRGPNGGFISTQDTVVGLQALGEMAAVNHNPVAVPFTVTVSWSSGGQAFRRDLTIDDSTKLLLQTVDVTIVNGNIPPEVQISASTSGTFTGFPEAKVIMEYNLNDSTTSEIFQMTYQILKATAKTFTLVVEAKRVDGKQGGMTLLEVGIPTGFSVDVTDPSYSVLNSKLQDQGHRKYILYYDEVNARGVRASLPMSVSQGIPVNTHPVPIKIYDYYEPGGKQQLTVYYQLSEKRIFICDSIAKYKDC